MKIVLFAFFLVVCLFFASFGETAQASLSGKKVAQAQALPPGFSSPPAGPGGSVPGNVDIIKVINTLGDWLFTILFGVALIFILYAAFKLITASGNPEEVEKAKQTILFVVIGIIVALVAKGIVRVLASLF